MTEILVADDDEDIRELEGDVQIGFGAGADDYVVKPFSPKELVSRVEAVLARTRA